MIEVRNRLEIKLGNVIQVPGCEPTSSLTSTGLLKNIDCGSSIIALADALAAIPGSRVVRTLVPAGQNGTGMFFELPNGPAPNANQCNYCVNDWYAVLRENAKPLETDEDRYPRECASIESFSGCVTEQLNLFRVTRDPNMSPNSGNEPVGGPAVAR